MGDAAREQQRLQCGRLCISYILRGEQDNHGRNLSRGRMVVIFNALDGLLACCGCQNQGKGGGRVKGSQGSKIGGTGGQTNEA